MLLEKSDPEPTALAAQREALWHKRLAGEEVLERHYRRHAAQHPDSDVDNDPIAPYVKLALKVTRFYGRGRRNAVHPRLRRVDFAFPNLPLRFDGFTLLQMSDLHFDGRTELMKRLAELLATVETDVCVLTGDYRYGHWGPWDEAHEGMKRLLPAVRARHGVFAVLGNHDHSALVPLYRDLGIRWLINEHEALSRDGQHIYLAGVDDSHHYRTHSLPLALHGIPEGAFRIVLAHSPAIFAEAAEAGVDLCLSGHTHCGQIRLPILGALYLNRADTPRRFCQGPWRLNGTQGYTSAGIGSTCAPVRFNCPPEAVLIRLKRQSL